jgi:sugar/nucleoside kinase (ribokinase family)
MNGNPYDVVVIGHPGIDTNVYLNSPEIDETVETNFTENIDYVAHAAGFSSRGFAQLGLRTAIIGYVGDDHNGRFIRDTFKTDGIDTGALFVDPAGTARSVNFVYCDGRRKNFYDGKGHMHLVPDIESCNALLKRARLVHFSLSNWARQLLPLAHGLGLPISCDIQDVTSANDHYRRDFVRFADILFFSAANHHDPKPLMLEYLNSNRRQIVIAGMGGKGCALGTNDSITYYPAVELDLPVVDSNGAGDSLAVAFLASYILADYSLEQSILRGQIAARFACSRKASSSSLITAKELDNYFRAINKTFLV